MKFQHFFVHRPSMHAIEKSKRKFSFIMKKVCFTKRNKFYGIKDFFMLLHRTRQSRIGFGKWHKKWKQRKIFFYDNNNKVYDKKYYWKILKLKSMH